MEKKRFKRNIISSTVTFIAVIAVIVPLVFIAIKLHFPTGAIVSRFCFLLFSVIGMAGLCALLRNKVLRITTIVCAFILLFFIVLLHCLELYNYSMQEDFFNYEFYMSMLDIRLLLEQLPYNLKYLISGLLYIFVFLALFAITAKVFYSRERKRNAILTVISAITIIILFCVKSTCVGSFIKMISDANSVLKESDVNNQNIDYAAFEKVGISTSNVGHDNLKIESDGIGKKFVFIILESFEDNFLDEELFPGLAPNLNRYRKDSRTINFSNMDQYAGSTAISMFQTFWGFNMVPAVGSSSCYRYVNSDALSKFVSLPFIFTKAGYTWEHIQSSDISNFYDALIKEGVSFEYWEKKKEDKANYKTRDKHMFDYAWQLYQDKIESGDNRFVISVSTMDSHHPNGRTSDETLDYPNKDFFPSDYEFIPLLNATYTTDYYLGQFIDNILNSEAGKDTVIAIMNDHRFMGDAGGVLKKKYRKNIFMLLNTDGDRDVSFKGCQIDVAPTIVDYFKIKTNYTFPLGVSLLDEEIKKDYDTRTLKKGNQKDFSNYVFQRAIGNVAKSSIVSINKNNYDLLNVFGMEIPNELNGIAAGKMFIVYLSDNHEIEDYKTFSGQLLENQIDWFAKLFKTNKDYVFLFQTNKDYEVEELLFNRMHFSGHPLADEIGKYGLVFYGKDGKIISSFADSPGDLYIDIENDNIPNKTVLKFKQKPHIKSFSYLDLYNADSVNQIENHLEIQGVNTQIVDKRLLPVQMNASLSFSCRIKNMGETPTRIYSGFVVCDDSCANGTTENQAIVVEGKKGNDYLIVQGLNTTCYDGSVLLLENLSSGIPNHRVISNVLSISDDQQYSSADLGPQAIPAYIPDFNPSLFSKVQLALPLDNDIARGTSVKIEPPDGAYIIQNDVVLSPGQDTVFNSVIQMNQPLSEKNESRIQSRGLMRVKPFVFSFSSDEKTENHISLQDFSVTEI